MASSSETSNATSPELHRGVCKWFNNKKGYGFVTIVSENNKGNDIFVHQSNINPTKSTYRTLCQGEYIQFNLGDNDNGQQAVNVRGIDNGPLMCDNIADRLRQRRSRRGGGSDTNESD